jgi:hypothetical protein
MTRRMISARPYFEANRGLMGLSPAIGGYVLSTMIAGKVYAANAGEDNTCVAGKAQAGHRPLRPSRSLDGPIDPFAARSLLLWLNVYSCTLTASSSLAWPLGQSLPSLLNCAAVPVLFLESSSSTLSTARCCQLYADEGRSDGWRAPGRRREVLPRGVGRQRRGGVRGRGVCLLAGEACSMLPATSIGCHLTQEARVHNVGAVLVHRA